MKTSSELSNLAKALAAAQGEMRDVQKTKQGYGYKYATLESILSMARPILAKNNLAVIQSHGNDNTLVTVTTRLMHSSGEWLEDTGGVEFQQLKGMNNAQAVGSAITYLRRYQLSAILNITSDEDIDAKADIKQMQHKNPQAPAQRKETLSEYLKRSGVKDAKGFCLKYGVNSKDQADALLADRQKLTGYINEYKQNPPTPLP